MQADVFTAFLTDKVKVFATKKGVKPFTMPKKYIRKAYPFLLCSAMVFSACGTRTSEQNSDATQDTRPSTETLQQTTQALSVQELDSTVNWNDVYTNVVNNYRLMSLKNKVPFSEQEIINLLQSPNPPALLDTNFNHCAENQQNFWEIVRNGINQVNLLQNSDSLTESQKKEYKITAFKMLSQMSKYQNSENEVDLSDYNNQKTFLFFEKVIKHQDDYDEVLGRCNKPGYNDERTEFLGRYYKDFEHLSEVIEDYPNVENFINALYTNNDRYIITPQDSAQANAISQEMFKKWLKNQNIEYENIYALTDTVSNTMDYDYLRGSTFWASVSIQKQGKLKHNKFAPVWELVRHELQHLGQLKPTSNESPEDNHISNEAAKRLDIDDYNNTYLGEIGPTLSSLAWEDQIYKQIHGIDSNAVVDYGVMIDTGVQKIPLGEIAVWWWNAEQKANSNSIDAIVSQPEILEQMDKWGGEKVDSKTNYSFMIIQAQQAQK